jgi:hypothetical protein
LLYYYLLYYFSLYLATLSAAAERRNRRCSIYLLYWYKSTNTDAAGACQARVAKSIGAVHQQQLQLAQVLARVRAEEADIVSRVSMLQIEHSKPFPANADHAPTLGEHARAGAPVHEPEPAIPLAVVRRIQASREEYVRSLQVLSLLALLVQKYNY